MAGPHWVPLPIWRCSLAEGSAGELAGQVLQVGVLVVGAVLVDTDRRLGRVAVGVELDRAADTVVVDVLALVEQSLAVLEAGALRATGADCLELALDGGAAVVLGRLGRERDEDRGVVRLRGVGEVVQLRVNSEHALLEVRGGRGTRKRTLRTLERAVRACRLDLGNVGREVRRVRVVDVLDRYLAATSGVGLLNVVGEAGAVGV